MNLHGITRVALLAMLLFGAFGFGHYSTSVSAQGRQKWEYRVVKLDRMQQNAADTFEVKGLSGLGEDGWEAVSINDSWVLLKRSK
jgi:hypothetical protein